MLLSNTCTYGIRAALLVSTRTGRGAGDYLSIKRIAQVLDVSFSFLTKVLQLLTQAKIMESHKGPTGGVRLARAAKSIYLMDIVDAIDGSEVFDSCILGLPNCADENPCPMHRKCDRPIEQLKKLFEQTSLAKLANDSNLHEFRL